MCVIGVLTGLVAFIIDITVKKLFSLKYGVLETGETSWHWERRSSWDRDRRSSWDGNRLGPIGMGIRNGDRRSS